MFTEETCVCTVIENSKEDPIKDLVNDPSGTAIYRPKPSSSENDYDYYDQGE